MARERSHESAGQEEVVGTRRRFSRRRWARRLIAVRPMLLVAGVLAVLGVGGWLVLGSSVLSVEKVSVEGTGLVTGPQVRSAAAVRMGEPLARVDTDAVRSRVERLPAVASADVSRSWPHAVRVVVEERTAVAVVENHGQTRAMDGTGVLFRTYEHPPPGLPLVRVEAGARKAAIAEAARVVDSLPTGLARRVDHVQVATIDDITLALPGGRTVVWGSAEDSTLKARVLAALLASGAGHAAGDAGDAGDALTYDVSVPGRPTTRG